MTNVIYAVKTHDLSYADLTIKEVKIGRTSNINSTMSQYNRSHRNPEILDIWKPNEDLTVSTCEKGVLDLAEEYAHERDGETFRFLQDGYEKFADNISLLLESTSMKDLKEDKKEKPKKEKDEKGKKEDYTGEKPEYFVLDGDYIGVKNWRDLLGKVSKKIYEEKEDFEKVLEIRGRTRHYFSRNDPDKLVDAEEIPETSYYHEGNLSANQIMNIVKRLMDEFGYDYESDFRVGLK